MFLRRLVLPIALTLPLAALAEPHQCAGADTVTITGAGDTLAGHLCDVAGDALRDLAACSLPLNQPLNVQVVDTLPAHCVGAYHCGEARIELLAPERLAQHRGDDGAFAALPSAAYLDSILVHELVHAALDDMPCPFDHCVLTQEYVAYAMQIRSLSEAHRALVVTQDDMERQVSRDAINVMILYMAPDIFAARAYTHLMQRDDPCAYVGWIAEGRIRFDLDRF